MRKAENETFVDAVFGLVKFLMELPAPCVISDPIQALSYGQGTAVVIARLLVE